MISLLQKAAAKLILITKSFSELLKLASLEIMPASVAEIFHQKMMAKNVMENVILLMGNSLIVSSRAEIKLWKLLNFKIQPKVNLVSLSKKKNIFVKLKKKKLSI